MLVAVTNIVVYKSLSQALTGETVGVDCQAEREKNAASVSCYDRRGGKDSHPR
jgi:hypothetical protein